MIWRSPTPNWRQSSTAAPPMVNVGLRGTATRVGPKKRNSREFGRSPGSAWCMRRVPRYPISRFPRMPRHRPHGSDRDTVTGRDRRQRLSPLSIRSIAALAAAYSSPSRSDSSRFSCASACARSSARRAFFHSAVSASSSTACSRTVASLRFPLRVPRALSWHAGTRPLPVAGPSP